MARLNLYLLGPPRIECDGVSLKVDTRKAIALLAYLAVTRESYRRDSLVNLLWPESDPAHGRAAFRRTLSALKKALAGDWLLVDRESVSLNPAAGIWLDVAQFRDHLAECLTHGHPSTEVCPGCFTPLREAIALYHGDFLRGFSLKDSFNFDDWQFFQAEALRRELAGALQRLVRYYSAQRDYESAITYARQWLELDHLSESAHSLLMQLYAWSGQRTAALRQYQECVRLLQDQLGVPPQESTLALVQAIKAGRASPPAELSPQPLVEEEETDTVVRSEIPMVKPPDKFPTPVSAPVAKEEKRIVTVLFTDISPSFALQRTISPENEATLANRFLDVLQQTLARYGGRLEYSLGGSALAVFGQTQTHETDPELAIRAALEIRREAEALGLRLSAGINTGEVYLGGLDKGEHPELGLMGTVVNLAVRLAGKAPVGQLLVGEATYHLTYRAFVFTSLSLDIKGMDAPVTAYQVERLLGHPQKARGIEGLKSKLIGRDEELVKLKQILAKVLRGQGQMVSLIGEAGVGKSRLVAELKTYALNPDGGEATPLWLEGRCLQLGTAASYWPFIDILRHYFARGAEDDDHNRQEYILTSLREMVAQGIMAADRVEEMWPYLGLLLSIRLDDESENRLKQQGPEQIRQGTFLAISDFCLALARRQPVVFVFEDLHWADTLSLDLISLLMEGLRSTSVLLLCVYRPEREHKCWHLATVAAQKCRARYTELFLRELSRRQSHQLVESLLAEELPVHVKDLILAKSQGNPFFIEEMVRALIEAGLIYRQDDVWRAGEALETMVVPQSVQSVILSRVDHLAEHWRRVLQVAAVMGRLFRPKVLGYAAEQADLTEVLWELEERALIYQERTIPELEYSFKHVLTQEAVYQNIPQSQRETIHQQVAVAIETLYPDSLDEYYEKLAYHYDRSGNVEQAVEYLLKAGEKAKRSYANEAAILHLSRGLELLETIPETPESIHRELDLLVALGVPLVHTKGHAAPEVEATYNRARVLCEQAGDTPQLFQILVGLRRYYFMRGALQTARELAERMLALAQDRQDPSYLSRATMMHSETSYWMGEFAPSLAHSEQGMALYNPQAHRFHVFLYGNDTGICCRIFATLAWWQLGYPDQALVWSQAGLAQAQELSHPFTLVFALYFTAMLHQFRAESQIVLERMESLLRISEEQHFALYLAWGTVLRGWALAAQGRTAEGIAQMQQGLDACQTIGAEMMQPYALALLIETYAKTGQIEEGLNLLTEALGLVEKNQVRSWEAELYRLKGELLLNAKVRGMKDDGGDSPETCFLKAIEVARTQQARSLELRAVLSLCRLWQKQGRDEEARPMLAEIYGWFTEGFDTADLQEAKLLLTDLSSKSETG